MKYTPLDIENADPTEAAFVEIADANDSPVGINGLFNGPDTTSISAARSSPSKNVVISESCTPDDVYEI